ncbi:ABC transporter G family member 37 [Hordeum vulgare]|nr:ABC transporter G family member 37 [Hordeum vulgare]
MNPTSALGPDGLPVKFFQTFENTIKPEIMAIFDEFFVGSIDLARPSFGIIKLIPKVPGATEISQFRLITVINVISRILAKGYANRLGSFPMSYLGIPISDFCLSVEDLRPTVGKLHHHIEPWQGRWLSKAARIVLINSSMSNLLLFLMSFYSLPETIHHEITTVQERLFWASKGDKQKYYIILRSEICQPREQGGLGIMSFMCMNIALLNRWLWQIAKGEGAFGFT